MRHSGSLKKNPPAPHPKKCSLFSYYLKRFCLFGTLLSKVNMGKAIKKLPPFLACALLHTLRACAAVIWREKEEEAELLSLRGASKRPRLFLLRLFIIPHRGKINHRASSRCNSPSHLDSFLYLFFVFVLARAHLLRFGREAVFKPNKLRWISVD